MECVGCEDFCGNDGDYVCGCVLLYVFFECGDVEM